MSGMSDEEPKKSPLEDLIYKIQQFELRMTQKRQTTEEFYANEIDFEDPVIQ